MNEVQQQMLERQRKVWSLGDYSQIAEVLRPASRQMVAALELSSGDLFLDVGAGTGNLSLEAAAAGARVIATDLTPHLIEAGKKRSHAEGRDIEWHEADAQDLPFADATFDAVGSAFGAMFAPDADAAVREMLRVTKPGGRVALSAWTRGGYAGQILVVTSRYLPAPPPGVDTVDRWGDEDEARRRFARYCEDVQVHHGSVVCEFGSRADADRFFTEDLPPSVAARMTLPPDRYEAMERELAEMRDRFDRGTEGRVVIDSEYLFVVARKPS